MFFSFSTVEICSIELFFMFEMFVFAKPHPFGWIKSNSIQVVSLRIALLEWTNEFPKQETMPNVVQSLRFLQLVHLVNLVIHFFIGHIPGASPSTSIEFARLGCW